MLGGVLATVMVVLGIIAAVISGRRPGGFTGVPVPPLQFMAIPFFDMVVFSSIIGTGFALRRNQQAHKRLMLGRNRVHRNSHQPRSRAFPPSSGAGHRRSLGSPTCSCCRSSPGTW